jgi:dihydrofolate synthase / folylpolyglutamate synthase
LTADVPGYAEALAALEARGRFGIRLGLGRTRALLAAFGNPERRLHGPLIAGTNGKGSVVALTGAALRAAGYRIGEMPKPHLVTYRERIQVNGRPIDPESFTRLVAEVLPVADRVARRHGDPTEFELLTAVAFRWFVESDVDLAVVEVGLGGRLDATHAWDGGVAAITNVELDHMDRLGSTVEAIAKEKAAIVMRGDIAVTGAWGPALQIIERRARRVGAPLSVAGPAPVLVVDRDGIEVELPSLGRVRVGLRGRHQAANVSVADATLDALQRAGLARVAPEARRSGYASVEWPGRLELVSAGGREVLLDGAHNPAGAATLARALDDMAPHLRPGRPTLVIAMMADKDVDGVLAALARTPYLAAARVIATAVDAPRALSAELLAARWAAVTGRPAEMMPGPGAALEAALGGAPIAGSRGSASRGRDRRKGSAGGPPAEGPVIVAGSLYLVGAARALLVDDPRLTPDPPVQGSPR